jgi:hypothetical protein
VPQPEPEPVAPPLQPADAMPAALARAEQRPLGRQQGDPLAAVAALSYEEKIALFT